MFIEQFKEEVKEHHDEWTNYREVTDKLGEDEKENEDDPDGPPKEGARETVLERPDMVKEAEILFDSAWEELEGQISGMKEAIDAKNKSLV